MITSNYLTKMRLNIKLAYIKSFSLSLYFFMPIWYAFETQFGTPAALGVIYALTHLILVILELPTGALADLMGRKKTVLLGLVVESLSWIVLSQAKNMSWLWYGYGINAIGISLSSGANTALNYDSLKELGLEKTFSKFSSKTSIIHRIGMILATFVGGYIYNYRKNLPYILFGLAAFFTSIITLFNTEPEIDTEKFNLKNYLKQTKLGLRELFKNEYIRDFSIFYVLIGGITMYFIYFLNLAYATEIGFTATQRSWLFSGIFIISEIIIFKLISSKLLLRKRVYLTFPILMIIGFLPGYWLTKTLSIVSIFIVQIASSARFSILDQYANLEFASNYRATPLSTLNMLVSAVFAAITLIAGKVINQHGPGLIMTSLGVVTILLVLPITRVLYVKHKHARD